MRKTHKKAMELSINFIVIMIFSIAILSSSFMLINQFFGKAQKMKAALDSDTESKIRSMLTSGERVAIPMYTREVRRGEVVTFGVGISNVLRDNLGPTNVFTVTAEPCPQVGNETNQLNVTPNTNEIEIAKNDNNIALIAVDTRSAERLKTYKCDITVQYTDPDGGLQQYADPVYKSYVKIK